MITLKLRRKNGKLKYTYHELELLQEMVEHSINYTRDECNYKCKTCEYKRLCTDLQNLWEYLQKTR